MNCINLESFGDRYRVTIDRDSAEGPRDKDPWLQQIRCRYGLIYPYSASHLAIQVDYHPHVARRLSELLDVIQDGDQEMTFIFTPDRFEEIAAIVQAKKRPQRSPQQIADATQRLNAWNAARKRREQERQALTNAKAG